MRVRRAAALLALVILTGCTAGTPGNPSINSSTGPEASTTPPMVTTLTVTTTVPVTADATAPGGPTTDLSGEVYGFVTAVDVAGATLTLDKIDWFSGPDAQRACAEDGVTDTSSNRCTGWYFRNRNPMLRTVPVDPDATITVLAGGVRGVPGDLAAVGREPSGSPWRVTVTDGRATALEAIYLP